MIVPADVAENITSMTDDEVVAAYVAAGVDADYARAVLPALRGEADPDLPIL